MMDWSERIKNNVALEISYLKMLEEEGMDKSVLPFLSMLSNMNDKPISHFVMMAIEEMKMYLDQEPEYEVELEEDYEDDLKETVH
tara:strand:- start:118 stop:372 length:255 start_codon:yes stop_codon:yes gene_type:complete